MTPTPRPATDADHPGRHAWVDASRGVAGDMLMAALLDAGASLPVVRRDVAAVIGAAVQIEPSPAARHGQRATTVDVRLAHPDQPHRSWATIRDLLTQASLPPRVRARALAAFERLAHAEARVHGVAPEEITFHEVGAWDSIADVVGVCAALEDLRVDALTCTDVTLGAGSLRSAHGLLPVPGPAVLNLLVGAPFGSRALPPGAPDAPEDASAKAAGVGELATPTGVALLATLARGWAAAPALVAVERVGVGAGHDDPPGWANVVRVAIGRPPASVGAADADAHQADPAGEAGVAAGLDQEWLVRLEANVDDLDPRAWPAVLAALLDAGAVDAWLTPILMKKGRPAHTVSALVRAAGDADHAAEAVRLAMLTHTSTLGVREDRLRRASLPRRFTTVRVALAAASAEVAVKVAGRDGRIVRAMPEYADCAALAATAGRPVAEALAAAAAAADAAGLRPGEPYPGPDRS